MWIVPPQLGGRTRNMCEVPARHLQPRHMHIQTQTDSRGSNPRLQKSWQMVGHQEKGVCASGIGRTKRLTENWRNEAKVDWRRKKKGKAKRIEISAELTKTGKQSCTIDATDEHRVNK